MTKDTFFTVFSFMKSWGNVLRSMFVTDAGSRATSGTERLRLYRDMRARSQRGNSQSGGASTWKTAKPYLTEYEKQNM